MKSFLSIYDLDSNSIFSLISNAIDNKKSDKIDKSLENKILALFFEKPSTRTRLSFDVAIRKLGGQAIVIDQSTIHLGNEKESIEDTAKTISQFVDIIMYRSQSHKKIYKLKESASVPVINGLSDFSHPCQAMADLMTIYEIKKNISGIKVNWIGPITNVARSWIELANLDLGIDLRIYSSDYSINEYQNKCDTYQINYDLDKIKVFNNLTDLDNSDVVITDTWESMGEKIDDEIIDGLKMYTINSEIMKSSGDNCIFMHCLPARRGQEVTSEVIDGPQSVVWDEAQNRLHIQKEILKWCL